MIGTVGVVGILGKSGNSELRIRMDLLMLLQVLGSLEGFFADLIVRDKHKIEMPRNRSN